jgi:hypothetical protein
MIEINCPHCGFALSIKPKYAGREGKCAQCNGRLRVPELAPQEPPLQRELPTPSPRRQVVPIESTALADLDEKTSRIVANSAPPPVSTALDELHRVDEEWQDPAEIKRLLEDAPPRAKGRFLKTAAAVVVGVPFLAFTLFAIVTAMNRDRVPPIESESSDSPAVSETAAAETPAPSTALRPPRPLGPAPTRGTQSNSAYAATGLPTYPGLQFSAAPNQENPLFSTLTGVDPAAARTFRAVTSEGYEEVSTAFYQQFEAQRWSISNSGYGNQANKEVFIVAQKGPQTLAYCTVARGEFAAVYITIVGSPGTAASASSPSDGPMVAIPLSEFPHCPGLEMAGTSTVPAYTMATGSKPNYQAVFEGVVASTYADVAAFYKDALEGEDRWASTSFSETDQAFMAKGGRGDFRYVLEGKPVTRGTHVVLGFVQPGTPF